MEFSLFKALNPVSKISSITHRSEDNHSYQDIIVFFVGGVCGAGKTELVALLRKKLNEANILANTLSMDNYYNECPTDEETERFRESTDFTDPRSMNWDLLKNNVESLGLGLSIYAPCYEFIPCKVTNWMIMQPRKVLIIEGMHALQLATEVQIPNITTILVTAEDDQDIYNRREKRDISMRGWSKDVVRQLDERYFKPARESIEKYRTTADHVFFNPNNAINNHIHLEEAAEIIVQELRSRLDHVNKGKIRSY